MKRSDPTCTVNIIPLQVFGKEFAYHQTVAKGLDTQGYFAHPYHSWERGLNENTNGLIRQYLPKGTDFWTLTLEKVCSIMDRLNNRLRKCLGFKTRNQLFSGFTHLLHLRVESAPSR